MAFPVTRAVPEPSSVLSQEMYAVTVAKVEMTLEEFSKVAHGLILVCVAECGEACTVHHI